MADRVSKHDSIVIKSYPDRERFDREIAVLRFLTSTNLGSLIPQVVEINAASLQLSISLIEGVIAEERNVTVNFAGDMGELVARIHALRSFSHHGTFNAELAVVGGIELFSDFLIGRLEKWHSRLRGFGAGHDEERSILQSRIEEKRRELDRFHPATLSHNDVDLKNIIVKDGKIAGIVDWEFAGAYPIAWEIRKIASYSFWRDDKVRDSFVRAYSQMHPMAAFPNLSEEALLVALDCIGALGWAYEKSAMNRIGEIENLLSSKLRTTV